MTTDWNKLKVPELKAELKNRGLVQTGLKAALVARLIEADNDGGSESEATIQGDGFKATVDSQTPTNQTISPEPALDPERVEQQTEIQFDAPDQESQDIGSTSAPPPEGADFKIVDQRSESQPSDRKVPTGSGVDDMLTASALATAESVELKEDIQKRKRRSQSPPPTSEDAPRKRARQDIDLPMTDLENGHHGEIQIETDNQVMVDQNSEVNTANNVENDDKTYHDQHMEDVPVVNPDQKEIPITEEDYVDNLTKKETEKTAIRSKMPEQMEVEVGDTSVESQVKSGQDMRERSTEEQAHGKERDSRFKDLFPAQVSRSFTESGPEYSVSQPARDALDMEIDRSVAASIHPATSALYIRDFMRPLNGATLKEHLLYLATPPGTTPDTNAITSFFLDPIRTHAFISFASISAASRVRSELHDRIWPDERTRKPLWVDFVPPERIAAWVEEEQSSGSSRSAAKKWEIEYTFQGDELVLSLQESGITPAAARKPSSALAPPAPARRDAPVSSRSLEPVAGPRFRQPSGPASTTSLGTLHQQFKSTIATPVIFFQPVSKELVNKRLDNIDDATSKYYTRAEAGSEINRYTFENGDVLVDRGPEVFPGIRPPPRGARGRDGGSGFRGGYGSGRGVRGGGGQRYRDGRRRDEWDQRGEGRDRERDMARDRDRRY